MRTLVEDRAPNDLAPIELDAAPLEVHALAKAINTLLAEVRESVNSQKRFISDAAHQLRTPLAGLKSQTELALRETEDPVLKERLSRVHQSAARSAHLVNQLLTLARAEPESAKQVLAFFDWSFRNGQKLAEGLDYVPFPDNVVKLVEERWKQEIKAADGKPVWTGPSS